MIFYIITLCGTFLLIPPNNGHDSEARTRVGNNFFLVLYWNIVGTLSVFKIRLGGEVHSKKYKG